MLTVVSAQKTTCFSNTSMYMPLTRPAFGCAPIDLERGTDRLGIVQVDARHERVGVAAPDHARAEVVAVVQPPPRFVEAHALALPARPHVAARTPRACGDVAGSSISMPSSGMLNARAYCSIAFAIAEQDRLGDAVLDADARGANDLRLFALGEDDALRIARSRD